jgi:hypothetical protein
LSVFSKRKNGKFWRTKNYSKCKIPPETCVNRQSGVRTMLGVPFARQKNVFVQEINYQMCTLVDAPNNFILCKRATGWQDEFAGKVAQNVAQPIKKP